MTLVMSLPAHLPHLLEAYLADQLPDGITVEHVEDAALLRYTMTQAGQPVGFITAGYDPATNTLYIGQIALNRPKEQL
jgi:hypothetical protein